MLESEKLDLILSEMRDIKDEMQDMKGEMRDIKDEMQDMKGEMRDIRDEMQDMKGEMQDIKDEMQDIKRRTTNIELTLENETNSNIKIIAEGHLDLNRKLDNVLKVENEKELLLIRVNTIENELHRVKEHIGGIA